MNKEGYWLFPRAIIESAIWSKPPLYLKVWVYFMSRAQHSAYKQLKRGQLFTSIPEIIEGTAWYVGASKRRATKDEIYSIIDWMRKPHGDPSAATGEATAITTAKATQGMLITICEYDSYQDAANYQANAGSNAVNDAMTTPKQRTPDNINKECINNENNLKNEEARKVPPTATGLFFQNLFFEFNTWVKENAKSFATMKTSLSPSQFAILNGLLGYKKFGYEKLGYENLKSYVLEIDNKKQSKGYNNAYATIKKFMQQVGEWPDFEKTQIKVQKDGAASLVKLSAWAEDPIYTEYDFFGVAEMIKEKRVFASQENAARSIGGRPNSSVKPKVLGSNTGQPGSVLADL